MMICRDKNCYAVLNTDNLYVLPTNTSDTAVEKHALGKKIKA